VGLLEIRNLTKVFNLSESAFGARPRGEVRAVDNVSLEIQQGETLGLVGESGSGKSTLGRLILRLIEPTSGGVQFAGKNLLSASGSELRRFRRDMQIIFQDPFGSLDPRYPHEFSGGQRQRIGIARALALRPKFIVADEPVSALDVSVGAQIVNLLRNLQREFGLTYLFISHSMPLVRFLSTRIAVMYRGQIVEIGPTEKITSHPQHAYTSSLLEATPEIAAL